MHIRVWVVGYLLLAVQELSAQSVEIRGVLFDSLRTRRPVANAEVRLLGTSRTAISDANGRFRFEDVPPAARGVGFWAPWLDSLDLPPLSLSRPGGTAEEWRDADLATPSVERYFRHRCGFDPAPSTGVLIGEARSPEGSAQSGIVVAGSWIETRVRSDGLDRQTMATIDTTGDSGRFYLCGVPVGDAILLRAQGILAGAGPQRVVIQQRVQRHDLVIGPAKPGLAVTGRVRGPDGAPVAAATIVISGTGRIARTDSIGYFELGGVPRRSAELEVRSIGFTPRFVALEPRGEILDLGNITLEHIPQTLDRVTILAGPYEHERRGFEERRAGAVGYFITEEQLKDVPDISANVVASLIPRLIRVPTYPRPSLRLRGSMGTCDPRFFIDGIDNGNLNEKERLPEQWDALQRAKRIEVYIASMTPPRFSDFDGCGAVVIWTR